MTEHMQNPRGASILLFDQDQVSERGFLDFKMAAWRIVNFVIRPQVKLCQLCRCGISTSSKIFPLTAHGSFRRSSLPFRITNVARYYEKPKEKKGPGSSFWAVFAGATSGILVGALLFLGNHNFSINFVINHPYLLVVPVKRTN